MVDKALSSLTQAATDTGDYVYSVVGGNSRRSHVGQVLGPAFSDFATKAAVQAATIPAVRSSLRIAGYTTAGDGGGALYKRAASEPSHEGKIQSADGAWWELAETEVSPLMFGADPTGAADSTAALQAAADWGGVIHLPEGTLKILSAVTFNYACRLVGVSQDVSNSSVGGSNISIDHATNDGLVVESHNVIFEDFNVHSNTGARDSGTGGRAIVVGKSGSAVRFGFQLRNVTTSSYHRAGLWLKNAQSYYIENLVTHGGYEAGLQIENQLNADAGDSAIVGGTLNAGTLGAGLLWKSGGGLFISNTKFLAGKYHIFQDYNLGTSANFSLIGCSLEGSADISIYLSGNYPFERMQIVGNTIGCQGQGIVVSNSSGTNGFAIKRLTIQGNTIECIAMGAGLAAVDLGQVQHAVVLGNVIDCHSTATAIGLKLGSNSTDSRWAANEIYNVTTKISNAGTRNTGAITPGDLSLINTTDSALVEVLSIEGDRATFADGDGAYVNYKLSDDAGTQQTIFRHTWYATDVNVGTGVDGLVEWSLMINGSLVSKVQLSPTVWAPVSPGGLSSGGPGQGWAGTYLAGSSSGETFLRAPAVAAGTVMLPGATGTLATTDHTGPESLLPNPGFRVANRGGGPFTSATTPANNDDTYLIDGCILLSDGNDIVDVSRETTTVPTGSHAAILLDIETANKKAGLLFPIETLDAAKVIGGVASLSFKARKGSGNATVDKLRAAIISWDSTADTITSDVVSAWNGEGTNPTLVANWTYENTPSDLTLTNSYQTFSIENVSIDTASTKNVAVFIWIDNSDGTVADFVYIADVNLVPGAIATPYVQRSFAEDQVICARYLRVLGGSTSSRYGPARTISASRGELIFFLSPPMRVAPTATINNVTSWNVNDASVAAVGTTTASTLITADSFNWNLNCDPVTANRPAFFTPNNVNGTVWLSAEL